MLRANGCGILGQASEIRQTESIYAAALAFVFASRTAHLGLSYFWLKLEPEQVNRQFIWQQPYGRKRQSSV